MTSFGLAPPTSQYLTASIMMVVTQLSHIKSLFSTSVTLHWRPSDKHTNKMLETQTVNISCEVPGDYTAKHSVIHSVYFEMFSIDALRKLFLDHRVNHVDGIKRIILGHVYTRREQNNDTVWSQHDKPLWR